MNGAQALLQALVEGGLETCFANPGTSEMQLVYEIGRTNDIRSVLCLQENTVTGAADGYARMAGKPALTLLHVGSGFANGIANLQNAARANSSMVNVVGANATYHQRNFPEHEFIHGKIVDLARTVSHWAQEAKSASDLAVLGALAARDARSANGKICTVIAPTDCHWDPAIAPPAPAEPIPGIRVSAESIRQIAALLTNGKKTGIMLGSRALHGEGLEWAGRIAAKTGADLMGETFPSRLARGEGRPPVPLVPYFAEMALKFFEPYEQLILVGAQLPVVTFAYQNRPVIKVPQNCQVIVLATTEHDILGALADLARSTGAVSQPTFRQARSKTAPPTGPLTDDAIGQSVAMLLPENAILVDEGCTMGAAIFQRTQQARAHDYLYGVCGGAIGGGLPLSLGAAVACPNRQVVTLQADGSGMYSVQALWSLAKEHADVVIILLKNDHYAILEIELARVRDGDINEKMQSMMTLQNPTLDWVKIAEGHGMSASRATTAEQFHQHLERALAEKGPHLIEAQVVQNIQPMIDLVRKTK